MHKPKGSGDEPVNEPEPGHPHFETSPTHHLPGRASLPPRGGPTPRPSLALLPFLILWPRLGRTPRIGTLRDHPWPRAPARAPQTPAERRQSRPARALLPARQLRPGGGAKGGGTRRRGRRGGRWDLQFESFGRQRPRECARATLTLPQRLLPKLRTAWERPCLSQKGKLMPRITQPSSDRLPWPNKCRSHFNQSFRRAL